MRDAQSTCHLTLWGHSLSEYCEMFSLSDKDLNKSILDFFPGPASFNQEMTQLERKVVSLDDIFKLDEASLETHISDSFQSMMARITQQQDLFLWENIDSPDALSQLRRQGIAKFLHDFPAGKAQHRYQSTSLPDLPFKDFEFELALCSHYLFGHRAEQSLECQLQVVQELTRVAQEVRIFPLLDDKNQLPDSLGQLILVLQQQDIGVEICQVNYQFQKNGNAMLRLFAQACTL